MTASKRLIVNADDFGRTPGINAGVFEAHARGLVSSATMMVGFEAAADAGQQLRDYPQLGVGLHVTLSGTRPVLPAAEIPSLVDSKGQLPRRPDPHRQADPEEILREVRAQFERFRELTGRVPTHLDGHHHTHRLPAVCEALILVAREAGGLPIRDIGPDTFSKLRAAGVPTTDRFVESFYGPGVTWQHLTEILRGIGPGVTEVMCHPGYVDDDLSRASTYTQERETETELLTRPEARKMLDEANIELIHFGALVA